MSPWQTFSIALEGLALNKARSVLTTLGVIIGVAAVIIMMAVSNGAEAEVADQINALGANLIMIQPSMERGGVGQVAGPPPNLRYGDLAAIEQNVTGISGISAEQNTNREIKVGKVTLSNIPIVGTTPGFLAVREYGVAQGRFVTDEDNDQVNDVVVLGYSIAQELFGDQDPIGQYIKIDTNKFAVVGVMEAKGAVGNTDYDNRVYVPIKVVFKRYVSSRFARDNLRVVYVSAQSKETMENVKAQLNTVVMQILNTTPDAPGFALTTQENIIQMRTSATETFRNLLAWVAGVSLIVGGIGIMNIMLVSVTERTREIGLRQALGARPRDVQFQFLLEAVVLSLVGGLVGVLTGVGGSYLFNQLSAMRTELVLSSIPLAFGAAAVVGIFFGYYPATKAAQLDPIEALRRE